MSLFQEENTEYLKQSKNKVICKYRIIDKANHYAEGDMYFKDNIFRFISGKYGKGAAPKGNYKAYDIRQETRDAFMQFDFGWQVPMEAQFDTDRIGLAIHPDGNIQGTLGCVGINFDNIEENIRCHNLFRDYFDKTNILNVEIV